jgi:translation initiation factor 2 subunit 2
MQGYEQLLQRLYEKMPENKGTGERFEIPVAEVFLEGSKTMVRNFDEICATLRREKSEVAKFLFKELATPGQVQGERLVLQRKLPQRVVQEKINSYVEQRVYCKECRRPDTHIEQLDRSVRMLVCEACGAKNPVRN